ncbi:MAG TPA: cobaltochelatase subunit CobN, partial [Verrucomicrobium sp.]|nr:cobaltochelatase subunit CobN [Verrucomicrobium sp.]
AFVGVWDRSMALVDAACREQGLSAVFAKAGEFGKEAGTADSAAFPLVMVLNLDAAESPGLTERLKNSREKNPRQKVLALDVRGSHADLDKAGLLEQDATLMAYWRANGPINLKRLMQYCRVTYLGVAGTTDPPVLIPEFGYYDPGREDPFEEFTAYREFKRSLKRWKEGAPTAVLLIQQSFWITRDLNVVNAQISALEKHGLNPVVVFGDREGRMTELVKAAQPTLLIEDRHGSMWQSNAVIKELDVPYLRPISMLGYTVDEWRKDPRGLSVRDVGMFMSLQESWGTIEPVVVGGLHANIQGFRLHEPIPDRIEAFAARAARWATLKTRPNAEKKVAVIYYNKGLGQDDLVRGSPTGAFLDGPESLVRFLPRLQKAGYAIQNPPGTAAELIATMKKRGRNLGPWVQGDLEKLADEGNPALIPLRTYQRWFQEKLSEANRKAVVEKFGPPPGRLMVVHRNGEPHIVIPRIELGNVILAPQPERGEKQDDKLLHSRDVPPPHNYLAFYWWLEEEYHADAIVHWGTHGTLELLPGKEAGLSEDCWSDICVDRLPVVDLWITDNLGESTLARRRSYAELVDHMVPPAVGAGLKDEFKTLHEDIHKFNTLENGLLREEFRKRIAQQARAESLHAVAKALPGEELYTDDMVARVDQHLHELYDAQTPMRLHVLGEPPVAEDMVPYLVSILGENFLNHLSEASPLIKNLAPEKQQQRDAAAHLLNSALEGNAPTAFSPTPELDKDLAFAREMKARLMQADREVTGLLHALEGGYIEAGPGPEPIRNPSTVPTGRNLYSLNPEEIPNKAAWEVAKRLVDDLLKTRKPQKIGMDLNGMETMRDFGVMEGQILYLLGVRPIWNRSNLVIDVELIPTEELKRPRVDVFVAMGGQYKENFPSRVTLLDKAVKLAASAAEEGNPVKASVAAMEVRLQQRGFSSAKASQFAAARIFGTKPGNMTGTNILHLVPRSGVWDKADEITEVYMDNMSFVYSGEVWGEKIDGLYEEALNGTDTILRVWASNMTSQLSNHHAYEYLGGLNMAVKKVTGKTPQALIADVRNPSGARVRDFEEVLATNLRSELLNKKWLEGMQSHDYAGAGHITELVKNSFGWSVTRPESISQDTWKDIYEVLVKDRHNLGLEAWFEKVSPHARQEITATLLEAARKGLWQATQQQIEDLSRIYAESIQKYGESGGLVGGGNTRLVDYSVNALKATGAAGDAQKATSMQESVAKSAGGEVQEKVAGTKLDQKPAKEPHQDQEAVEAPTPPSYWQYAVIVLLVLLLVAGFFKRSGTL